MSFVTPPNFEAPTDAGANNVYNVNVSVSDGSLSASRSVAVTVDNVNEAPAITAPAAVDVASVKTLPQPESANRAASPNRAYMPPRR